MLKNFTLSFLGLILGLNLIAQENHLIVFSEDLHPFYAYVNGIKQNTEAQPNVKITDLESNTYQLIVKFEDETLPDLKKNLFFDPMGQAYTLKITQTKKGLKLRMFGMVPISESPSEYTPVVYHSTEIVEPVSEPEIVIENTGGVSMNTSVEVSETRPQSTTSENVNVGINIGGLNMGVDVNISETTTQSVETTETITYGSDVEVEEIVEVVEVESAPCGMSSNGFNEAKESIKSKSFADSKMVLAKQITKGNCLDASQIRDITALFDFESDRLDYAKFAYSHCADTNNYYKVNDAFEFEMTIEELNEFIEN